MCPMFHLFLFFFFWKCVPVHYSRDPQTSFFNKTFIKNGSHDTIHTFKNYFVTVFSVFNKISGIQTHLRSTDTIYNLTLFVGS